MIIKTKDELKVILKSIMIAAGADERNADLVAKSMVLSNLSGVDTHGTYHLPLYIDWIKKGELIPDGWPEIVKETEESALVKGNWTFGQVTARFAMNVAIGKAKKNNMSIVSSVEVTHTGRLGEYVEMAVKENMISFIFSGGFSEITPITVPFGGKNPVLSTNPFAMGFPGKDEYGMISDYATSATAGTKVMIARDAKKELQDGCMVDLDGKPTRDPKKFFTREAYFLPFGGHKGYAIMLANEFLGGIFSTSKSFAKKPRGGPFLGHSGFTIIVFKADLFGPYEKYLNGIEEMRRRIRKVPPAPGYKQVLIPGDLERRSRRERIKNGIPIPEYLWRSLKATARSVGLNEI